MDNKLQFMNFACLEARLNLHLKKKIDERTELLDNVQKLRPEFPVPRALETLGQGEGKISPVPGVSDDSPSSIASGQHKATVFITSHNEDITEFEESSPEIFTAKVNLLKQLILDSRYCMIFTGAGISTAANLPDYRSNSGIWTKKERGEEVSSTELKDKLHTASPTLAHKCVAMLVEKNLCKLVVSTNIDGLHFKSGIPPEFLAELHGNCYKEICSKCKMVYERDFVIPASQSVGDYGNSHLTGRNCADDSCKGDLVDTIVCFGESLPERDFQLATRDSFRSDLAIVIGSSMRVSPACTIPLQPFKNHGKLVIINRQNTPFEDHCWLHIYADIEQAMQTLHETFQ